MRRADLIRCLTRRAGEDLGIELVVVAERLHRLARRDFSPGGAELGHDGRGQPRLADARTGACDGDEPLR